jgi:hypothetical protein
MSVLSTGHPRGEQYAQTSSQDLKRASRPWCRFTTATATLLSRHYVGQGTEQDPYIVDWLEDDNENPLIWKSVSPVNITANLVVVQMGQRDNRGTRRAGRCYGE